MSKITRALEKAARERLKGSHEPIVTAPAEPVKVPILPVSPVAGSWFEEIAPAPVGQVAIDPHIVSATNPNSPITEQYRILRTNFQALRLKAGPQVIVVTSAVNGEGKSVTSTNLALTLARQENMRVVLVDADMRRSSIPRWLGLREQNHGLSTILQYNRGEMNGSLVSLQSPRLTILPAGPTPDHPDELLQSVNMKRLLAALKARFDLILIDAPPVLPVADPRILASMADGVILVVRAGRTQKRMAQHAQQLLKQVKANVLGCVLTHAEYYMPGYSSYYRYHREGTRSGDSSRKSGS